MSVFCLRHSRANQFFFSEASVVVEEGQIVLRKAIDEGI